MPAPGQSGNPLGRPVSARRRFSQQFISNLTNALEQYGADALAQTAKLYPDCPERLISERHSAIARQPGPERLGSTGGGDRRGALDRVEIGKPA